MRPILTLMQVGVDPVDPTGSIRLFNLGMKILFVVAIVAVLITFVMFGYFLVIADGLIVNGYGEPNIQLSRPAYAGWEYIVDVAGVSEVRDLANFRAILLEDMVSVDSIDPLRNHVSVRLEFTDLDGGGTLSIGDYFTITCNPGSMYSLHIIWKDSGNERGSVEWET